VPALDVDVFTDDAPDRCVVLAESFIVGVFDRASPSAWNVDEPGVPRTTRGGNLGATRSLTRRDVDPGVVSRGPIPRAADVMTDFREPSDGVTPDTPTQHSHDAEARPPIEVRHMNASFPRQMAIGDTRSLLVWISKEARAIEFTAPLSVTANSFVDIVVQPLGGLEIEGSGDARVKIGKRCRCSSGSRRRRREPGSCACWLFATDKRSACST
jgi:hypothetical protein